MWPSPISRMSMYSRGRSSSSGVPCILAIPSILHNYFAQERKLNVIPTIIRSKAYLLLLSLSSMKGNQTFLGCQGDCLSTVGCTKFAHNRTNVKFGCTLADDQVSCNFLIRHPLSQQAK